MNLIEQLDGIKIDFKVHYNGEPVTVISQYLVKRPESASYIGWSFEFMFYYGNHESIKKDIDSYGIGGKRMYTVHFQEGYKTVFRERIEYFGFLSGGDGVIIMKEKKMMIISVSLYRMPICLIALIDGINITYRYEID